MTPIPIKFCRDTQAVQLVVTHSSWLRSKATLISGYIAFSIRVINNWWNNLSNHVVSSSNTNTFKDRLDSYWKYHPARYDWEASDYFHPGLAKFNN